MSTRGNKPKVTVRLALSMVAVLLIYILHPYGAFCEEKLPRSTLQSFDGNWWAKAASDERIGFLYALDDCLTYDVRPAWSFDDTWANYEEKITSYYAPSTNRSATVQRVFESFGKRASTTQVAKRGERYGDEFWRAHNDLSRRGFLEGYISCRIHRANEPQWSKPINYYLEKLNDMYNADDRHGENAPEYTGSVASALDKLRDNH
jgi:hypothetical protein